MEMVLVDWTRMGRSYCLAGVVADGAGWRVARPLPARSRMSTVRNVGWSPFLMEGHSRWEIFELVKPEVAPPQPPHLEDVWVRSLRPRRCLAPMAQRRAILQATCPREGDTLFGAGRTPAAGERSFSSAAYFQCGRWSRQAGRGTQRGRPADGGAS